MKAQAKKASSREGYTITARPWQLPRVPTIHQLPPLRRPLGHGRDGAAGRRQRHAHVAVLRDCASALACVCGGGGIV